MGEALLPVFRNQLRLVVDLVDVVSERQSDHIRIETVDDRPRLFAGTAVGLLDDDPFPGFFPLLENAVLNAW